ncbi:NHL repeat containing protein, partial [Candidatus Magnetobacterium bavaricum]
MSKNHDFSWSSLARLLVLALVALMCLIGSAAAEEKYVYKNMWPKLEQSWYFSYPNGIAVDSSGNVYVADEDNHRIQKFSSSGVFLAKWGSKGSGDGQFYYPGGIAVDSSGNVYVADTYNDRIQKFSSSGVFLAKWDSKGSGDGQFYYPYDIAVDSSGNVYVVDASNDRIQKFSSSGVFLAKWGSKGSGDGQFYYPDGIEVDSSGNVYVADKYNNRIQVFSKDTPTADTPTAPNKAIIVAGSGPNLRPRLWDEISLNANYAYLALNYQGFAKDAIYYLSYDTELDMDNNGIADDVKGKPTNSNLKKALTEWAPGAKDVVVYMMGHGGSERFRIGETE